MSRRKSTRKLGRRRSLTNVKPRRRLNAKKAVRTDRGRGPWAYGRAWR
jgi:hypothetical protein